MKKAGHRYLGQGGVLTGKEQDGAPSGGQKCYLDCDLSKTQEVESIYCMSIIHQ